MWYNASVYQEKLEHIIQKMRSDSGVLTSEAFIKMFTMLYTKLVQGVDDAYIREDDIEPVTDICEIDSIANSSDKLNLDLISKVVVVKLNGGLGTTMGLNKAKSLLPVVENNGHELTFLDIIVQQILKQREKYSVNIPLILMNSINTSVDTLKHLEKYPNLCVDSIPLQIMQHYEPKISIDSLDVVSYPENPRLEWCPPGHGDFFTAIYDNNILKTLVDAGRKYAFISNSDNLGAVFDPHILDVFANSGAGIMLELTDKTVDDIKGGHIVKLPNGQLVLREVAQIHPDDHARAVDLKRHPYFNTNSLWIDLEQLYDKLVESGGILDLRLIKNIKTVNPVNAQTQKIIQLETAIGSAISCFSNSTAIKVSRDRFIPVKTTDDYNNIRSTNYGLDSGFRLRRLK
ncbi:MAG: UTP--glucose-1-phosphate uridylyltransferase [Candidatus Ancillula sp.]|jgi:UTP--glucose-1-phosphate uridylyltransferase|nr:UTP--glucose-1-phosphate uridylyltransferase [Candidatus Ancillula sp.]